MEIHQEIFVGLKRILMAVSARNSDLSMTCPVFCVDEEERNEKLKKVAQSQQKIDDAIAGLRELTGNRLKEFSDAEILLLVHLLAGVWASDSSLRVDSTSITDIVGANRPEDVATLVLGILNHSSPLFRIISVAWEAGRHRSGNYSFSVHDCEGLHQLFLGQWKRPTA